MDLKRVSKKAVLNKDLADIYEVTEGGDGNKLVNSKVAKNKSNNVNKNENAKTADQITGLYFRRNHSSVDDAVIEKKKEQLVDRVDCKLEPKKCLKDKASLADSSKNVQPRQGQQFKEDIANISDSIKNVVAPNYTNRTNFKNESKGEQTKDKVMNKPKINTNKIRGTTNTEIYSKKAPKTNTAKPTDKAMELKIDLNKLNSTKRAEPELTKYKANENLRKPTIKTVTGTRDSTKVYKEVVFDNKRKDQKTPLQISVPTDVNNFAGKLPQKLSSTQRSKPRIPVENVVERKKNKNRSLLSSSPDISKKTATTSNNKKVAKWAPTSVSCHTKPYYEAWVDTSLAAFSKITSKEKDKLLIEKDKIIESLQRALAVKTASPTLALEILKDQKYIGKIKVHR